MANAAELVSANRSTYTGGGNATPAQQAPTTPIENIDWTPVENYESGGYGEAFTFTEPVEAQQQTGTFMQGQQAPQAQQQATTPASTFVVGQQAAPQTAAQATLDTGPAFRPATHAQAASGYAQPTYERPDVTMNDLEYIDNPAEQQQAKPQFRPPAQQQQRQGQQQQTQPKRESWKPVTGKRKFAGPEQFAMALDPVPREEDKLGSVKRVYADLSSTRTKSARDAEKEAAKSVTHNKHAVVDGEDVISILLAAPSTTVGFEEISLGDTILFECLRNGNAIINRVNAKAQRLNARPESYRREDWLKDDWTQDDFVGEDAETNLAKFVKQINQSNLWITLSKSPVSEPESYQARRLKIHHGDGLLIHPWALKAFNADVDGDEACLHLSGKNVSFANRPTRMLIGNDGNPTIDADFLITLYNGTEESLTSVSDMFKYNFTRIPKQYRKELFNSYIAYCKSEQKSSDLATFIRDMFSVAEAVNQNNPLDTMSYIVDTLYHATLHTKRNSIAMTLESSGFAREGNVELDYRDVTAGELDDVELIVENYIEQAKKGVMPPSYQQFVVDNAHFVGDIAKKNTHFRVGANIAKQIKRSEKVYVGEKGLLELWQDTAEGCISLAMSSRAFAGEKERSVSEWLRNSVISEVGFPSDATQADRWAEKFAHSYNRYKSIVDCAKVEVDTFGRPLEPVQSSKNFINVRYDKGNNPIVNLGELAGPLVEIYTDFTVGKFIGDHVFWSTRQGKWAEFYDSWKQGNEYCVVDSVWHQNVRVFASNNRFSVTPNVRKKEVVQNGWPDILEAIADSKTGTPKKHQDDVVKVMSDWKQAAQTWSLVWRKYNPKSYRDAIPKEKFDRLTSRLVDIAYKTAPSMFGHFEMDNPDGFINSKYGQAMMNDDPVSVRMAMTYEWRMSNLHDHYDKAKVAETPEIYEQSQANLLHAANKLAASSDVWEMLVDELLYPSEWNRFLTDKTMIRHMVNGQLKDSYAQKAGFFDIASLDRWPTVRDFVLDTKVNGDMKAAVLADMVCNTGGFFNTLPIEILYQLELSPSSAWSGLNTMGQDEGKKESWAIAKEDITRVKTKLQSYYEKVQKHKGDRPADEEVVKKQIELVKERCYEYADRSQCVTVPKEIFEDFVKACEEKAFADSEKAKNRAVVSAAYSALARSLDGGLTTEFRSCDSMVLGRVNISDLTQTDFYDVIFNDKVIPFFDENGVMGELSREALGIKTEDSLYRFLYRHPSLEHLLKETSIDVSNANEGEIVSVTRNDLHNRVDPQLASKPCFVGLCAMLGGYDRVIDLLGRVSSAVRDGNINLRESRLCKTLNSFDVDRRQWGLNELSMDLGDEIADKLLEYSSYVFPGGSKWEDDITDGYYATLYDANRYYDARQTARKSKTNVSTGVEGYETERRALYQLYLDLTSKDRYRAVSDLTEVEKQYYISQGAATTTGLPFSEGTPNDAYVVDEDFEYEDPYLGYDNVQMSSISRFHAGKRSKSGEAHNLKMAKSGMGDDTIFQNRKYQDAFYQWPFIEKSLRDEFDASVEAGIPADVAIEKVRLEIAKLIQKQDVSLDYEGYDFAFYLNIASNMATIVRGKLVIRSLDQQAQIVNNRLAEFFDIGSIDFDNVKAEPEVMDQFTKAVEKCLVPSVAKTSVASALHAANSISGPAIGSHVVKRAKRERSSSFTRNIQSLAKAPAIQPKKVIADTDKKYRDYINEHQYKQHDQDPHNTRLLDLSVLENYRILGINGCNHPCSGNGNLIICTDEKKLEKCRKIARDNWMVLCYNPNSYTHIFENYWEGHINNYGEMRSASFWLPSNTIMWTVEDPDWRYDYADSSVVLTRHCLDRVHVDDEGVEKIPMTSLFADSIQAFDGFIWDFRLATAEEIADLDISDLDLGITNGNSNYDKVRDKTDRMMREFMTSWDHVSPCLSNAKPDRIVAFAACDIEDPLSGTVITAYAPIVPFRESADSPRKVPKEFDLAVTPFYNGETGTFDIAYRNTASLENGYAKTFEMNAAIKGSAFGAPVENMQFANGVEIDTFTSELSSASRLVGDNTRIETLLNLFMEQYTEGSGFSYNFAEDPGAFPEDPDMRTILKSMRIPEEDWWNIYDTIVYHVDDSINAFVGTMVAKCLDVGANPSDFLANVYNTVDTVANEAVRIKDRMIFEWRMVMETSYTWEDGFLKFMHRMCPDLCPDGIYGDSTGCLYRVCQEPGWKFGCLQKWVPYPGKEGGTWCVVRGQFGFFGEQNSATKRASLNGASLENQALLINMQTGRKGPGLFLKALRYAYSANPPRRLLATSPNDVVQITRGCEYANRTPANN